MFRRLLTLLAILTGLTAVGAPAQARYAMLEDVRVQAAGEQTAPCQSRYVAEQARPLDRLDRATGQTASCPKAVITVIVPTIYLHADRSRE